QMSGGKPLMQALKERQSLRVFSTKEVPVQVLSNMLWAAFGINRPDEGKRTAPSSSNVQDIDIYVATAKGCYLYDAKAHTLVSVVSDDIRALTGTQDYVGGAPVNLVYVSDFSKLGDRPDERKYRTARLDTGFISQNVYLFCASEGLATVVRGLIDTETLSKAMKLRDDQRITLAQSVGYPK
ncbi:MAG TPA: SagB/ThcOx family dehydrogenase, partial [Anaerolineae bacterium]|nr:SagB/ThcOx family dehydrogenase [Anaerolineae bacterium]